MRDERSTEIMLRPLATYPPNACDLVSGWTGLFRSHRSTAAMNFMKFIDRLQRLAKHLIRPAVQYQPPTRWWILDCWPFRMPWQVTAADLW